MTATPRTVRIDGRSLRIQDVVAVARDGARVEMTAEAHDRMVASNAIVNQIVERNEVVYGVTTGFGKLSDIAIPPHRLAELQVNLIRSHAVGVGPLLAEDEVRAMMLLRANVIAKGYSGARPVLVELLAGNVERRTVSTDSGTGKCWRKRRPRTSGPPRTVAHRRGNAAQGYEHGRCG